MHGLVRLIQYCQSGHLHCCLILQLSFLPFWLCSNGCTIFNQNIPIYNWGKNLLFGGVFLNSWPKSLHTTLYKVWIVCNKLFLKRVFLVFYDFRTGLLKFDHLLFMPFFHGSFFLLKNSWMQDPRYKHQYLDGAVKYLFWATDRWKWQTFISTGSQILVLNLI